MSESRLRELYLRAMARRAPATRDACPSPDDLLALAEGRAPAGRRDELLDHVTTCAACHGEFVLLRTPVTTGRAAPRVWAWWGLAAAAAVAAVGAGWWALGRGEGEAVRGDAEALEVVAPGPSAPRARLAFMWRSVPGATGYEVRLGAAGSGLRSLGATTDTAYRPADAPAPGDYVWIVRALFSDGRAIRSLPRRLTVTP
ncbi:MAG TPA: hypothetical protein VLA95_08865 [Gemmatimonadales bacterium]|nr:hypothetical protein [Gemmatimonadales bacterium]